MRPVFGLLAALSPFGFDRRAHGIHVRSPGCGTKPSYAGGTRTFSISSSGGERQYLLYIPESYDGDTEFPLIVGYHGASGSPQQLQTQTRYSGGVNKRMIVAYPLGVNYGWQGASYAEEGVSDKVFTADLVHEIKANYCIDQNRIYAVGFSQGGGFVGTLACSPGYGGQFAAFAAVEGGFYTNPTADSPCHPARKPLPILTIHSNGDEVLPYHGGMGLGGPLPPVAEWTDWWVRRNGCGANTTTEPTDGVMKATWDCSGESEVLQHYMTNTPWHGWAAEGIDVSTVVYDFLSNHHLNIEDA